MSDYGNYSSDEASNDEIGFPKTPGQPLAAPQSDDNSDNASSKSSSESNNSDSDQSDDENETRNDNKRKSDSDDDNGKKSSSPEQDSDDQKSQGNKSSDSNSDSDSDNENIKPASRTNERIASDNENSNNKASDSSSDDEEASRPKKVVASDSESDSNEFMRESRKRKQATLDSSDDSDQDDGDHGGNNKDTTAKDLFGDLSDEDDDNKSDKSDSEQRNEGRKKARFEDDEDDEDNEHQADKEAVNDIFGTEDDEDRAQDTAVMDEEEEPVPETRIEVEIPRIMANLGNSIHFVKLPNFLSIDTHPYDPQWYEDEIDEDEVHDDEGRARLKLKVENTIRWRNVTNEDGTTTKESNARVVKWSDGSMSMHLGDEIFDIQKMNLLPGENNHLFVRQGTGLQGQSVFQTKLTFRPFSTESFTHRKLTLSLADRSQKTQKICVLPSVGKDPEAHRSEMIKKEEDKLKAAIRKESTTRRVKDRAYTRGPNSSYLEHEDEDDESISIAKIKNQYKNGPAYSGSRYSSESDNESDDSDEDIFEKKKHTEKRKIVESDEDED